MELCKSNMVFKGTLKYFRVNIWKDPVKRMTVDIYTVHSVLQNRPE